MATTQDIHDLKAQFDERVAHLRESFGVVESNANHLDEIQGQFKFPALDEQQNEENDIRHAAKDLETKVEEFDHDLATAAQQYTSELTEIDKLVQDSQAALDQHLEQHAHSHGLLKDTLGTMTSNVDQAAGDAEHARGEYLGHVQQMHDTLSGLADKLSATSDQLDHSVRETQTNLLSKAAQEFHTSLDAHIQSGIPSALEQAQQTIIAHIQGLNQHGATTGDSAHQELVSMINELIEFAKKEFTDKVEHRFEKVMSEAVASLMEHITEGIATTTVGVGITTAMAPILPEAIAVNAALSAIRPAIKVIKELEDIF